MTKRIIENSLFEWHSSWIWLVASTQWNSKTAGPRGRDISKLSIARPLPSLASHIMCLNFNEVLGLADPSIAVYMNGTEKVWKFGSFWMAMEPSQLRWPKKVFCFVFIKNLGFRKVSKWYFERIFSGGLTVNRYEFPTLSFFINS